MNEPQPPGGRPEDSPQRIASRPASPPSAQEDDNGSPGPNLKLLYTILAVALAAAIGMALLIVLPFYRRH